MRPRSFFAFIAAVLSLTACPQVPAPSTEEPDPDDDSSPLGDDCPTGEDKTGDDDSGGLTPDDDLVKTGPIPPGGLDDGPCPPLVRLAYTYQWSAGRPMYAFADLLDKMNMGVWGVETGIPIHIGVFNPRLLVRADAMDPTQMFREGVDDTESPPVVAAEHVRACWVNRVDPVFGAAATFVQISDETSPTMEGFVPMDVDEDLIPEAGSTTVLWMQVICSFLNVPPADNRDAFAMRLSGTTTVYGSLEVTDLDGNLVTISFDPFRDDNGSAYNPTDRVELLATAPVGP